MSAKTSYLKPLTREDLASIAKRLKPRECSIVEVEDLIDLLEDGLSNEQVLEAKLHKDRNSAAMSVAHEATQLLVFLGEIKAGYEGLEMIVMLGERLSKDNASKQILEALIKLRPELSINSQNIISLLQLLAPM